jgi:hypothetical protein
MKIDVSILWVDDNHDFVESLRPQLEKWMDAQGLILKILWHPGEAKIYDDLQTKDVELIVLDYKLKGPRNGDAIITELRSRNFYEDVIFYTTKAVPNVGVFETPPDGVFFVDREDARERIKTLIEMKVRRASDLATVRGWIVADAIELENLLGQVLCRCFKSMRTLFHDRILTEDGLFDLGKKHKVLNGILKDRITSINKGETVSDTLSELTACKEILDLFPKEIIEVRNTLAHQVAEITGEGLKKLKTRNKDGKEVIFTPAHCVTIRKNIGKHFTNLKALEGLV